MLPEGIMKKESSRFANSITKERFKNATKRKFGPKFFKEDMQSSWIAGCLTVVEEVHRAHQKENYMNAEEMLGDMQVIAVELFNHFNVIGGGGKCELMSVEKFFKVDEAGVSTFGPTDKIGVKL